MLTAAQLVAQMEHALGKTPDSRNDLWAALNRAGRRVFSHHEWTWATSGLTDVATTAGSNTFALPADFDTPEVFITKPTSAGFAYAQLTSAAELLRTIERERIVPTGTPGRWLVAFQTYAPESGPTALPTPTGMVWPTPGADNAPTFQTVYRRKWRELASANPTHLPNLPDLMERALLLACRAEAKLLENDDPASADEQALVEELERQKVADMKRSIGVYPIRGGAGDRRGQLMDLRPTSVNFPS